MIVMSKQAFEHFLQLWNQTDYKDRSMVINSLTSNGEPMQETKHRITVPDMIHKKALE